MTEAPGASRRAFSQDRALFPVLLAVFFGVFLSMLLGYFYTRDTVEGLALGQATQTLGFLDREVTARTREMAFLMDLWSQEDVFRLSLEDTYLGLSAREAANRRLAAWVERGAFVRIFLLDRSGNVLAASDSGMVKKLNVLDRPYFQSAMAGRATQESIAVGRYSGRPILVTAAPVLGPDRQVLGALAASLDITEFAREVLDAVRLGKTGGAYILDFQGGVLGAPSWAGEGQFAPGANAAAIIAAAGQESIAEYQVRGVERMAQARRNEATGWFLVVEADRAEILSPASRLVGLSGVMSLVTLLLVALALGALRRAMLRVGRSEANFRTIFESAPYAITLNRLEDGAYLDANLAFFRNQGLTREQVLGNSPVDLGLLRPEEMEAIQALLRRDGYLRNAESTVRRKDGSLRHVLYSAHLVDLGAGDTVLTMTVDMTEKKEAAMQAFRWRQKFEVIASVALHLFYDCNLAAGTEVWSGSTREVLGYDGGELKRGRDSWQDMIHPADREVVQARLAKARRDCGAFDAEYRLRRKDGTFAHVHEKGVFIAREGGVAAQMLGVIQDVTARKLAELALEESEQKYRAIFYNAPLGIFRTTHSGRFVEANPALAHMFGYASREEMLAQAGNLGTGIYPTPEVRARLLDALAASPGEVSMEIEFKRRDGTPFFAIVNAFLQLDSSGTPMHLDGTIEDVTERKEAQDALRQSEEKFSQLFRLSPDPGILVNLATRRLVDVNNAYTELFGYGREEVVGKTTRDLDVYADLSRRDELYEVLRREGQVENFEIEAKRKDGAHFIVLLSVQIMEIDGEPHMLGVFRDITETKRMQEMMIQTEKMISVGGIAAGIAHEINNPLGIVLQASQNLEQRTRPDFPKNQEVAARLGLDLGLLEAYMQERKLDVFIQDIRTAAVRASEIIRHMLDFSRRSESKRRVCDIPCIVDKALALAGSDYDLKKRYDFKRITVVREFDDDLPSINCTETEIEQVLLNLLRNAAQAMALAEPPVAEPRILVRVLGLADRVRIEIEDNGPGMPVAVQRRIFEPFYTTKPPGEGTGLGLSVSYFIVTKGHGGRMSVYSEPGSGTRFSLDLPVDEARESGHGA